MSRWGHSSVVFDRKIYVFAGRFSNDLNDVLVIDISNNTHKGLKMGGSPLEHPKPRRRHCASFMGSCMIIFGGSVIMYDAIPNGMKYTFKVVTYLNVMLAGLYSLAFFYFLNKRRRLIPKRG